MLKQILQVEHHVHEQRWYEKHQARRKQRRTIAPAWINTHKTPSVTIVGGDHSEDGIDEANNGYDVVEHARLYKCKYCVDGRISAEFRLVRFCGTQESSSVTADIAMLHLYHRCVFIMSASANVCSALL